MSEACVRALAGVSLHMKQPPYQYLASTDGATGPPKASRKEKAELRQTSRESMYFLQVVVKTESGMIKISRKETTLLTDPGKTEQNTLYVDGEDVG